MQHDSRPQQHPTDELFRAERVDLRREIMSSGVLLPLIILGYVGVVVAYQKPFVDNLDLRVPTVFTLPPKLMADIHVINHHAQHLLRLVNEILDLSQMDVNYLTVSREPIQVRAVIDAAVADYAYLAEQRGLRLAVQVDPALPTIVADATRIRQVLLNLLSNALRVTDTGGITVGARLATNDEEPALNAVQGRTTNGIAGPSSVVVSVADTGIGIALNDLPRIFDAFVQVGDANWRRNAGSGLGLTISKRFVELHGGRMWVESTPGIGSTFFFALPIQDAGEAASAPQRSLREIKRREVGSLTVVERSPALSRLMERHIVGIRVETVGSLDELALPQATLPEVVLINEPITAVPASLPLSQTLSRIPVFRCYVHGALALPAIDGESSDSPNHYYLIKPVNREQLYTAQSQMLAAKGAAVEKRPARILIVEDEEDASYLLGRMLRLMPADCLQGFSGVTVLKARSGEQALDMLGELAAPDALPIDALLLDLVLGGVSGHSVLAEMERRESLRDIPVCVITGQVSSEDLLVTPYLAFSRKDGLSARELAQSVAALTRIALPGVDVTVR